MNIFLKNLISIFYLLSFHFLCAQQVSGYVRSESGEGVSNASVLVLNTSLVSIADSLGYYEIKLKEGNYQIMASAVGYSTEISNVSVTNQSPLINLDFTLKDQSISLGEVLITANKQDQNLVDVPISITNVSSQKMNDTRTWKLEDLRALVPNYQYADLGVSYQQLQSIRGISVFSENPSVATYIDGVNALDVSANGLQLIDVERIEILRGPQGTMYGRNAMAGVVNIITKQPESKFGGFSELSVGNQGLQRYSFGVKMPLIHNRLFVGLSGNYQKLFGYYTNDLSDKTSFDGKSLAGTAEDGKRMGDEENLYSNFFIKWIASKKMKIVFNIKAQNDKSIGASMYYQAVENELVAFKKPYKMAVSNLGSNSRTLVNNSLSINYTDLKYVFTAVTAYQYILQTYKNIDQDLLPYSVATGSTFGDNVGDPIPQSVISQEFRVSSPALNKKIQWVSGLYFFNQKYNKRYAANYDKLALLFGEKPGTVVVQNDENNLGIAVFGQALFRIMPKWELTFGLRYDHESREVLAAKFYIDSLNNRTYSKYNEVKNKGFSAFSPKSILSYKPNPLNHTYLSYSKGFRAGGINAMSNVMGYETFKPEYSDNMELGHKYNSKNKKYAIQISLFYLYWKDLQLDFRTNSGIYVIHNIGNVQSKGLEIELTAVPINRFQIDGSLGLNRSRYQDFIFLEKNIKGNKTILTPKITSFLGIQYQFLLSQEIKLVLRAESRYMGQQYFDLINTIQQPGYVIFNTRAEFKYKDNSIAFWIQNVGNKTYLVYAMPGYFRYSILNRPRIFGVTFSKKF